MPIFFYLIDNAIPICRLPVPIFSGRNLIKEPAKTIRAHGTPSNIPTNGQTTVPFCSSCNLIDEPAKTWNPPNIFIPPNLYLLTLIAFS